MTITIKYKRFFMFESFSMTDEYKNLIYTARKRPISSSTKIYLFDKDDTEVAFIKQKALSIFPEFLIEINDKVICTVKKTISTIDDELYINELDWYVSRKAINTVFGMNSGSFYVSHKGNPVMEIRRINKPPIGSITFDIDVFNDDIILCLCVALTLTKEYV